MRISAIITAAGSGSRFKKNGKNPLPKQFIKLNGKPVILYSLLAFQKCRHIDEIIISAPEKYFDMLHSIAVKNGITKLTCITEGGKTRFESVRNAFFQADNSGKRLVMIHDAARPNIDIELIDGLITGLKRYDGITPGIKISETVKRTSNSVVTETIDRNNLFTIQTPQLFKYEALYSAYLKCGKRTDFTDEASLMEYAGYKIRLAEGKKDNIKITTPEDLKILRSVM